jgi:Legionella pneumophila major outer membrane protein precursor
MAKGTWRLRAALAAVLALLCHSARAQEQLPGVQNQLPAPPRPADTTPETAPPPAVEAELAHAETDGCLSGKFFAVGEYLLLQPRRTDLDFVVVSSSTSTLALGSIESVDWHSNSGFRVGGGYQLPDHWEIGAYYTYLWTDNSRSLNAPPGGALWPTLSQPLIPLSFADSAVAAASLQYQLFDVEIGQRFEPNASTSIWLGGGGRFAWIDQNLQATYSGGTIPLTTVSSPINFYGAGLRFGAEGDWKVYHGIGFYGRAFGSLLTGDFRTSFVEGINTVGVSDVTDRIRKIVPVTELGLGVYWQWENWRAQIGYEMSNWFGMVDSPDFVNDVTNKLSYRTGDLSLDGLRVVLQFDY